MSRDRRGRLVETISTEKAKIAERKAPAGQVIVEFLDIQGQTLALDTLDIPPMACHAMEIAGVPATRVLFPDDTAQQEVTLAGDATLPFALPPHLSNRRPHTIRLWWSCNHAQ